MERCLQVLFFSHENQVARRRGPNAGQSLDIDGLIANETGLIVPMGRWLFDAATPALAPFIVSDTCVASVTGAAVAVTVSVNPTTGNITRTGAGVPGCATGAIVGRFVANAAALRTAGGVPPGAGVMVMARCLTSTTLLARYSPVFSVMATGPNRIIGFSQVDFVRAANCPNNISAPFNATITRRVSTVAASNASAIVSEELPAVAPAVMTELLNKNLVAAGQVNYGPVLVPVLVR